MAFDFGPKGRAALTTLSKAGSEFQRKSAKGALASEDRWEVDTDVAAAKVDLLHGNFKFLPAERILDDEGKRVVVRDAFCRKLCKVIWLGENRFVVVGVRENDDIVHSAIFKRLTPAEFDKAKADNTLPFDHKPMTWDQEYSAGEAVIRKDVKTLSDQNRVELRNVEVQQIYVDGQPVGQLIRK